MQDGAKIKDFLLEWTLHYLKNRDLISKKIESIEKGKDKFDAFVKYKDKDQYLSIIPQIKDLNFLERLDKEKNHLISVFNTKENLSKIVDNWHKLIDFKLLCILFVNPWSSYDKRWIIYPYTHHRIADESSLKAGLKSMFETVEPVKKSQLENLD